ncbi:MAG: hypothetical protein HZB81_01130 [Deltaproteobacteria bacterium]|nr:hypothetical protein [Deltaproteobacteria bacterium]
MSQKLKKLTILNAKIMNDKGVALIIALLMSVAIMAMVAGVLYFLNQSTSMSGAGKRYATAAEAADGAVNVMKDSINLIMWGESILALPIQTGNCSAQTYDLAYAVLNNNAACTTTINLLSTALGGNYTATVTVTRLYSITLPGGRLEFARSAGGVSSTAIFYRITTSVTGPDNSVAENSALYRFTG